MTATVNGGLAEGPGHSIIVVGASAGGGSALRELLGGLDPALPAAIFVVRHLADGSGRMVLDHLATASPFPVAFGEDGEPIRHGQVRVAPPDHHLTLRGSHTRLSRGPRENRSRPAIDPLFRSAAVAHGSNVVGVLLSGMLDDGTVGMHAIKRCGGVVLVQDPAEAEFPSMPQSALDHVVVSYCGAVAELAGQINRLARTPPAPRSDPPHDLALEVQLSERIMDGTSILDDIGSRAAMSCPECAGPLWQLGEKPAHFRCHVGHAYSVQTLLEEQDFAVEQALWVALRSLEERARMLRRLGADERERASRSGIPTFTARAVEVETHAQQIRALLVRLDSQEQ